jgi:hypothetical protein
MKSLPRIPRLIGQVALAAMGAAALTAAVRAPLTMTVKGVTYRVKVDTRMPNFVFGGGGAGGGGGSDAGGGGGGGGGGFPGGFGGGGVGQLVRVELAGDRAKVEFQVGNPPGSSITDYYVMLLDSNRVYRVSPDAQTFSDATLAANVGGRGGRGGGGGAGGAGGGANRGNRGGNNNGGDNANGRGGRGGGGNINPMQVLTDAVVTDVKTNVEDLGAGDFIETRPTKHYKITVDYGFKLYGQPREGKTVTEIWTVDIPQRVINPFEAVTAPGDSGTMADVTRRLIVEAKKIPGVPVKVVTTQTVPVSAVGGDQVEVTAAGAVPQTVNIVRTTTITAIKEGDIDEADLKVPDGYKKVASFGRGGGA